MNHPEMEHYRSLLSQQLPIEIQFLVKLADDVDAETVLGTIRNRDEAVQWLGYTYSYLRMLRDSSLYNTSTEYWDGSGHPSSENAPTLCSPPSSCLRNASSSSTKGFPDVNKELGRIASHCYVTWA